MRTAAWLLAIALAGCTSERAIELAIEPPRDAMGGPDVPAEVVAWEVRVSRLEDDDLCPNAEASADARPFGRLGDAQAFAVGTAGMAVGELPSGRWAFAVLARDAGCRPLLYGCEVVELDSMIADAIVVPVEPSSADVACGCRTCAEGFCDPVEQICE